MTSLLVRNARVLTMGRGAGPRRAGQLDDVHALDACDVLVEDGIVRRLGPTLDQNAVRVIDAGGRVVMPAFVDCHTHLCWAGDRLDEWEQRRAGATYLEILEAGGGIMSTVRAVRAASETQLADDLSRRLQRVLHAGTTTIEIKSGYGLSTEDELKMLRAIARAGETWPGEVVLTACIGHAKDQAVSEFCTRTTGETLDAVHSEFPGIAIDAYCEQGAWTLEESRDLFQRAADFGHPCRVHVDQFNPSPLATWACDAGFVSVDHLEASPPETIGHIAASGTIGVLLPCSGYHVDQRYADGRGLIDKGAGVALATNANPGSSPTLSIPMAVAMGVRGCGLTAREAIHAVTTNGAAVLGFEDRGRIEVGCRADLVVLEHTDERQLAYEFGGDPVVAVICGGEVIRSSL